MLAVPGETRLPDLLARENLSCEPLPFPLETKPFVPRPPISPIWARTATREKSASGEGGGEGRDAKNKKILYSVLQ